MAARYIDTAKEYFTDDWFKKHSNSALAVALRRVSIPDKNVTLEKKKLAVTAADRSNKSIKEDRLEDEFQNFKRKYATLQREQWLCFELLEKIFDAAREDRFGTLTVTAWSRVLVKFYGVWINTNCVNACGKTISESHAVQMIIIYQFGLFAVRLIPHLQKITFLTTVEYNITGLKDNLVNIGRHCNFIRR